MMDSSARPSGGDRWYVRPGVVLPIIAAMVLLTALLAPDRIAGRTGDARLSTYSTEPQGAHLFYELAQRLGWQVDQRRSAEIPADLNVIHAVLAPATPLRMGEVHALLEQVWQGGALLVVLDGGTLLADSLRVTTAPGAGEARSPRAVDPACAAKPRGFIPLWPDNRVHLTALRWKGPPPSALDTLVLVDQPAVIAASGRTTRPRAAAVGLAYGRGRIVVGSDPDLLRNDVLRACEYGLDVAAVRMLEYLRDRDGSPRDRIMFDEYHQGFGPQPGTLRAIASYLADTQSGHVLFQVLGAGLVLLLAVAPRVVPPREALQFERRSPLEHVDALARAYAQVGATRTAATRLLRGVRRRTEHSVVRTTSRESDEAFLTRVHEAVPALTADVGLIRQALSSPLPRREFVTVGAAIQRLETTLTRT